MKFEEVLHGAERHAPQDSFLWVGEDKALNFFIFFFLLLDFKDSMGIG